MDEIKKNQRKEVRKKKILDGALKAFCERGVDSTTIDDICDKVKCSHGLFYHYYKSKDELLIDLKKYYEVLQNTEFEEILNATVSPKDKFKEILLRIYSNLKEDEMFAYHAYFFLTELFRRNENDLPIYKTSDGINLAKIFYSIIKEGQEKGEFRTDFSATELLSLIISSVVGTALTYLLTPKSVKQDFNMPNVNLILSTFLK
ncbi:MAG: TetR/AcrR family transcriptional regulator [Clostridia bacterium]|nr:TetR/AcrR family transcriptional regulator [Clostridia bacterium]